MTMPGVFELCSLCAIFILAVLYCRALGFILLNVGYMSHKIGGDRPDMNITVYLDVQNNAKPTPTILQLGIGHWRLKLYKVYVHYGP